MITRDTLLTYMAAVVNADAAMVRRGQHLRTVFQLGVGEALFYVSIDAGRIDDIEAGPRPLRQASFSIRADGDAWAAFWQAPPPPGFHDIFALAKSRRGAIEGDIRLLLQHLLYVKDVLAAPRGRIGGLHA